MSFGGQQCSDGAAALNQGVGRQSRAMDDQADAIWCNPGLLQDLVNSVQHGLAGMGVCCQQLGRDTAAGGQFQHHVGKGAADVDREAGAGRRIHDSVSVLLVHRNNVV